jgi:hypothetical protein
MLFLGGTSLDDATGSGTASSDEVRPAAHWTSSRDFDPGLTAAEAPIEENSRTGALAETVKWLHYESGLTWEQIANLFDVSRRSVHLWATGGSMNSRHFARLSEVTQMIRGLPASTPKERRELLLLPGVQRPSLYDVVRDRLASDYVEANYDAINSAVREALTKLDGSAKSTLSLITGLSSEEIDDLGGLP